MDPLKSNPQFNLTETPLTDEANKNLARLKKEYPNLTEDITRIYNAAKGEDIHIFQTDEGSAVITHTDRQRFSMPGSWEYDSEIEHNTTDSLNKTVLECLIRAEHKKYYD